ncbi:MAG: putative lipid II flippase FtsW [Oscillospiraceae bacterium]|jgi:cell division protein FtsW|nr:putative lipid II flippase FtsW [Oscillospiraceae bacterium]
MDLPFLMLVIMLSVIGLVMMFSASYASALSDEDTGYNAAYYFIRQGLFAVMGMALMLLISRINYQILRPLAVPLMASSIALLVLVLLIGVERNYAKRWINLGPFQFQPSEIAKLAVIVCFSAMISVYKGRMKTFRHGVLPFVTILGAISFLMYLEPHLSGTVLILGVGGALMFVGGVHWGWFAGLLSAGGLGAYLILTTDFLGRVLPYAMQRIKIWRDPFLDPQGSGYQAIQSLYAIGSGGMFGLGLGKSRQKYLYLPEEHNDFVFAIVCEELGLIGACIVLLLFAVLILRGYWIAIHARDRFGSLMVTGIVTLLAMQTFFNVAVVTNLIPVTGMSMPFFSYGGTSLLIQLMEMGIVLAVSRQIPAPKSG